MRYILSVIATLTVIAAPAQADDSCVHTKDLVIKAKRAIDAAFQNEGAAKIDIQKISEEINSSDDIAKCSTKNLEQLQKAMEEFNSMGL